MDLPLSLILVFSLITGLLSMGLPNRGHANSLPQLPAEVETGLTHLLALCASEQEAREVDLEKISAVAAFVRSASEMGTGTPQERDHSKGSYIAYSIARSLPEIIRYTYNHRIPEGAINPSSVNYSYWKELPGSAKILPDIWKSLDVFSEPLFARGVRRESIAPDLHTGAYYEYDLQRAFIIYRQGTMRVVVSLSNQLGDSEVGRKGFIVGNDQDWNYLYTQAEGLNKSGLGWVKSKIYSFRSVCFYVEDSARPGAVRIGVFQWLGAGWAGINLVDSHHIRNGLERYAKGLKGMLESERMPDARTLEHVYAALNKTQEDVLREKALDITRHIKRKAEQDHALREKGAIKEMNETDYVARLDKERLVSMLMREFVKYSLGKETPLSSSFWLALKDVIIPEQPFS